ncbi:hypothetical protein ACFL25_00320 [Patescibacteria group bacterium]
MGFAKEVENSSNGTGREGSATCIEEFADDNEQFLYEKMSTIVAILADETTMEADPIGDAMAGIRDHLVGLDDEDVSRVRTNFLDTYQRVREEAGQLEVPRHLIKKACTNLTGITAEICKLVDERVGTEVYGSLVEDFSLLVREISFEERVAAHMERLKDVKLGALYELANTFPGGPCDAPFAPIDPALNAAAQRLVRENELVGESREFGLRRGMIGL